FDLFEGIVKRVVCEDLGDVMKFLGKREWILGVGLVEDRMKGMIENKKMKWVVIERDVMILCEKEGVGMIKSEWMMKIVVVIWLENRREMEGVVIKRLMKKGNAG
ncbi:hypothetical protein, partial [Bacillus pumilus]|uniref:hypothetical protein n=1 Tax=Bacillus pumilus TaxID=1408 RepID=UPI0016426309